MARQLLQSPSQNEYLVLFSPNGYTLFTIRGYSFLHTKLTSTNPVDTPDYSFWEVIHFEGDTFREGSLYSYPNTPKYSMWMYHWVLHRARAIIHPQDNELHFSTGGILYAMITAYEPWYCYISVNSRS